MPKTQTPRKLVAACPDNCSLRESVVGAGPAALMLQLRQNGAGGPSMAKRMTDVLNRPINASTMARHVRHYREVDEAPGGVVDPAKKLGDLEILDLVIQRGAANSANWKPSIKDTIEAMKLKLQMTGNSAFEDLIALFDGAEAEEDGPEEAPEAVFSEDEAPEDKDALSEPLL